MTGMRTLLLGGLGMALAAPSPAQRQVLPYGLRAGRHVTVPRTSDGWYPVAADSGPATVLLLVDARPEAPDSATALYLASHGYVVLFGTTRSPDVNPAARVELHPAGALLRIAAGSRYFTVAIPPGDSGHIRLRAAVAHAFLNAALRRSPPGIDDVARRLRAAGLAVTLVP